MDMPEHTLLSLYPEVPMIAPERPCWAVYEYWVNNEEGQLLKPGVYWHAYKHPVGRRKSGDEQRLCIVDEWVSTPVTVAARTIDSYDGSHGRRLRLLTDDGVRELIIAMEVFSGSGKKVLRQLFSMGAIIAIKKRSQFMEYLLEQQPADLLTISSRQGVHAPGLFVSPNGMRGNDPSFNGSTHLARGVDRFAVKTQAQIDAEDRQILASLSDFIDKHGSSRFSCIKHDTTDLKVHNRAGYWEVTGERRLYLFNKPALIEAGNGHSLSRIIKALEGVGGLAKRDSDRKRHTKKYRLPGGGSAGLYVIDPEAINGESTR